MISRTFKYVTTLFGVEEGEAGSPEMDSFELFSEIEGAYIRQPQLDIGDDVGVRRCGRHESFGHIREGLGIGFGGEDMVSCGSEEEGRARSSAVEFEDAVLCQSAWADLREDVEHAFDFETVTCGERVGVCGARDGAQRRSLGDRVIPWELHDFLPRKVKPCGWSPS